MFLFYDAFLPPSDVLFFRKGLSIMKRSSPTQSQKIFLTLLIVISLNVCCTSFALSQKSESAGDSPTEKYGEWNYVEDQSGSRVAQMRLRVYPQAAPVPAFKYRLVPAANDRVDGNSALFYLKAMGFFEQSELKRSS